MKAFLLVFGGFLVGGLCVVALFAWLFKDFGRK